MDLISFFTGVFFTFILLLVLVWLKPKDRSFEDKLLIQWGIANDLNEQRNNALDFILEALQRRST